MIPGPFKTVFLDDFTYNFRRPLYWIWYLLLAFNAFLLSRGSWIITSLDTSVGQQKSWVNSEFQLAFAFTLMTLMFQAIFASIATGSAVMRDEEYKIGPIIHATPLSPGQYIWGRFLANLSSIVLVLLAFPVTLIVFDYVLTNPDLADIHGPFVFSNYFRPVLLLMLPGTVFFAGAAFALGVFTRRVFPAYLLGIAIIIFDFNWFMSWHLDGFGPTMTKLLQYVEPGGFRWLKQEWLMADRGVSYYNTQPVGYEAGFLLSRLAFVLAGVAMVWLSARRFAARLEGSGGTTKKVKATVAGGIPQAARITGTRPLEGMTYRLPGFLRSISGVFRFELREQRSQAWLYLFMGVISVFIVMEDPFSQGGWNIQPIYTSGTLAATSIGKLTGLLCFMLMFSNAESFHREQMTNLAPLYQSTPVPTAAILLGKALANMMIAFVTMLLCFLVIVATMLSVDGAPMELMPFVWLWGLIVVPTLIFWTALNMAAYAVTGSRMAVYGTGAALIFGSIWLAVNGYNNWLINWTMSGSILWSDFGNFDIDANAIILNRLFYLSLAVALYGLAVKRYQRRMRDPHRRSVIRQGRGVGRLTFRIALWLAVPALLAAVLWSQIQNGFQGEAAREQARDYWRHNVATWMNARLPHMKRVELDLDIQPEQRSYSASGTYLMTNLGDKTIYRIPISGLGAWQNLEWTLNGQPWEPENRSGLFVFEPAEPLAGGGNLTIGFSFDGVLNPGVSKNGGPLPFGQFILESGGVVNGRNPYFIPVLGYLAEYGIDEENRYEPKVFDPDFYEGVTGSVKDRSQMMTRVKVTVPEAYRATSMGVAVSERISGGKRTTIWESDYPVRVLNLALGKWAETKSSGGVIYHHPQHVYNLESMVKAMDGAMEHFPQWYGPYPWKELRINEFPGLAFYAMGNPTNIFFSESVGFLTRDATHSQIFGASAFYVTAHEIAHQWWGHVLSAADGPGTILLVEGMANYAAFCLVEELQGRDQIKALLRQSERVYGERRFVSTEKPLIQTELHRPADTTVAYDKGGWVFWMMRDILGEEAMNRGCRDFIEIWHPKLDQPVLQEFLEHMAGYAQDTRAWEHFVDQWFYRVTMPEYRYMIKPEKKRQGEGWQVRTRIRNFGDAIMPVEVAVRSEDSDGVLHEVRTTIKPIGEQEAEVILDCDFEPEWIVIDPDVRVLQLQRRQGTRRIK